VSVIPAREHWLGELDGDPEDLPRAAPEKRAAAMARHPGGQQCAQ
jgi:hypothetical protein